MYLLPRSPRGCREREECNKKESSTVNSEEQTEMGQNNQLHQLTSFHKGVSRKRHYRCNYANECGGGGDYAKTEAEVLLEIESRRGIFY